jgi:ureidoglycolate hydrolase
MDRGAEPPHLVWRHPLISLDSDGDFLIVDRAGEDANLVLQRLAQPLEVTAPD